MIAGLILAAGAGTRFGSEPKLLADLDGRPLLERAVRAQSAVAALERVVVVLGSHADEIVGRVDFGRAEPVLCQEWNLGQAASLRCGVRALPEASKVIVTLGDEPLITPELIERFVGEPPGTRAVYHGRPGHPVVLGGEQLRAIGSLSGDHGARGLLDGGLSIECAGRVDLGRDVDTPEDLEMIRDEARPVL
ncbi:MAG: nucleotidyltransferase family protein [Solirubrobacterales bacterium]|nr:nucleotidyltransferase family protein [Solirubrobacterales bacterium]MBV9801211.1 nucleotidyltransferase family protein [Solirubrobacterales bacterium]